MQVPAPTLCLVTVYRRKDALLLESQTRASLHETDCGIGMGKRVSVDETERSLGAVQLLRASKGILLSPDAASPHRLSLSPWPPLIGKKRRNKLTAAKA